MNIMIYNNKEYNKPSSRFQFDYITDLHINRKFDDMTPRNL